MPNPVRFFRSKPSIFTRSVTFLAAFFTTTSVNASKEPPKPATQSPSTQYQLERQAFFTKISVLIEDSERSHQAYMLTMRETLERIHKMQLEMSRDIKELTRHLDSRSEQQSFEQ